MADAKKIDPFDVEALEKSLNDSATRVSTIWISFLIFALYLLVAAATVDHRHLLLAEPIRLPILNIDLPLWGFFFLAPIQLVIFHVYVLLQVLLLGRTAAAYNEALQKTGIAPEENAAMRQRLANTLFAQIFAGSPREREGWLGWLMRAMAWITLAIAPILILLAFQFAFLPYHSHLVTWMHRLLILLELGVAFPVLAARARRAARFQLVENTRTNEAQCRARLLASGTVVADGFCFSGDCFLSRRTARQSGHRSFMVVRAVRPMDIHAVRSSLPFIGHGHRRREEIQRHRCRDAGRGSYLCRRQTHKNFPRARSELRRIPFCRSAPCRFFALQD